MELTVDSKLSYCSIPSNTSMKYLASSGKSIITTSKPSREIMYFFRTEQALAPTLLYGKVDRLMDHPHKAEKQVAVNLSILPSYYDNQAKDTDYMTVAQNKIPTSPV